MLATVTTAVGFLTNVTNDIPALAEFGELAAVGIVVSFLLMLTFVPAVREVLDRRAERHERLDTEGLEGGESRALPRIIGKAAVLPKRFAWHHRGCPRLLTVIAGFSMTNLSTKFSFLDFVPTTSPLRDTAVTVDERFDFPETTSVLVEGRRGDGRRVERHAASRSSPRPRSPTSSRSRLRWGASSRRARRSPGTILQFLDPDGETFDAGAPRVAGQGRTRAKDGSRRCRRDARPSTTPPVAKYPVLMAAVLSVVRTVATTPRSSTSTRPGERQAPATSPSASTPPSSRSLPQTWLRWPRRTSSSTTW